MSGNSMASLLAWMKDNSRMLGWGIVVALERRKTNLIVLQEYIRRFNANSYLPPIRGEVDIVTGRRMELIHDFVMDVPVLSFENANLNDSKALLTMAVMGGSQLTLEKESVGWKAYKVDEYDPLQGPKLYLDLLLNEVPGNVDVDGRVKLDLSKSDNFRLTFASSGNEQRLGGSFFKDLFNKLPDEKRIYSLGKIERGSNELMHPQSFELRTQASGPEAYDSASPNYGEGAVLALIRTERRLGGNFPGAAYKYLIPDDLGKDYSATVLFDRRRLASAVMIQGVGTFIQSHDFDYVYAQDGELNRATATAGSVIIPEGEFSGPIDQDGGSVIDIEVTYEEIQFPVSGQHPLVIEFLNGKLVARGSFVGEAMFFVQPEMTKFFAKMKVDLEFAAEYEVVGAGSSVSLQQKDMTMAHTFEYLDFGVAEHSGDESDFWTELIRRAFLGLIFTAFKPVFESVLKEVLKLELRTDTWLASFINETIKLNFGQAIQGNEMYAPQDIGFFGRINPAQTTFLISPMQPVMKQGGSQQFTTNPVVAGVQWKVENLIEGPDNPGTISAGGLYRAPVDAAIKGRFTRVRVTATVPATGYFSSALVTVVINELSVHPLIQVCDVDATVELAAGSLDQGQLQWSIKNRVPGESGEVLPSVKPDGDHTYHHGPVVANKTYVLDEIEVKNPRTNETRSVHVLALQKASGTTVSIVNTEIAQGRVQLQANVNGTPMEAQWSLPLGGPGSIDQTGLYSAAATATQRFVLIFALVDGGPFGKFEGHLILPLPLVEFPRWLKVLSQ